MSDNIDLRTCPIDQLCEWVATNIMEWRKNVDGATKVIPYYDKDGEGLFASDGMTDMSGSLGAVAAVEAKAREGRLKDTWTSTLCFQRNDGTWAWSADVGEVTVTANAEPEARLRAVALAFEAGKDGAR